MISERKIATSTTARLCSLKFAYSASFAFVQYFKNVSENNDYKVTFRTTE